MTLKEKFKEILTAFWINDWEDECEKVADEFAIEFAIWLVERVAGEKGLVLQEGVLERFKKEKGL
jgi:hypothetical protein